MPQGRGRDEVGVTDAMVAAFGETVFELSNNLQTRRGDPIRLKDFDAIEANRAELGMADAAIAERLGLTPPQVAYIRNIMEMQRFERRHYHRLNQLGGGRRYRAERISETRDERSMSETAQAIRASLTFRPELAKHYVEQGYWGNDTLRGWLEKHAAERPNAPAVICGDQTVSYSALRDQVASLAAGFYSLGLRKGDGLAIQAPNDLSYMQTYLACAWMGLVMTTIYMPHREKEFDTLMRHSGVRVFVGLVDAGGFPALATALEMRDSLPNLDHIVSLDAGADGAVLLADLLRHDANDFAGETPVAADPLMLLYTSGTTASPKGVPHPSHTVVANGKFACAAHNLGPDDIIMSGPPFGHLFGLYSIHMSFYVGAANLLLPMFTPPAMAEAIEQSKPTHILAAPAHIAACLGLGLFDKHDVSSVRVIVMSGAAVPASLAKALDDKLPNGCASHLWGMTECQCGTTTRPADGVAIVAAGAGRPLDGNEVRIIDPDGNEPAAGAEGELQVRGPMMFPGYFNNPDANQEAFSADGWFITGDLATKSADGNIAIVGRSKDVINRGGVKYNPRDIEDLLVAHKCVEQAAIVPMPDEILGERACCFITRMGEGEVTLEGLCDYLLSHNIAKTTLPERLVIVDEMPLTPTRKIIKGRLVIPD
jgi:cyclohexanecarboxylate-CoA ligase